MAEQNNNENNSEYDLYTEHIVSKPFKNVKRIIKQGFLGLVFAIIFGLIAGLVTLIVYKTGKKYVDGDNNESKVVENETDTTSEREKESVTESTTESTTEKTNEPITIAPIETEITTETETTETEPDSEELLEYSKYYKALKSVTDRVNQSIVVVTVTSNNRDWFSSTYQNISEESGIIISEDSTGYYILTDYSLIKNFENTVVTFPDGNKETATFIAGDTTTNIAVIKTATANNKSAKIASLGSSETLTQGEMILAIGKLYGFAGSLGYGIVTGNENVVNDTDSAYHLINTDIIGVGNTTGVLANIHGEITGIITSAYNSGNSNLITGYAINDISRLIERLSNGNITPYFGIRGQEVTDGIGSEYKIPKGIYITAVEGNSPAFQAGIQNGDVIISINGKSVFTMKTFMKLLGESKSGDSINIVVKRKGREEYKEIEFNMVLGVE